jgi:ATP-dependent Clp protease ATP-binding subunit ClpA
MADLPRLTPRMLRTLERAREIANENGQQVVGTEHVILALVDDSNGIAGQAMRSLGIADAVRATVRSIIQSEGYKAPPSRPAGEAK